MRQRSSNSSDNRYYCLQKGSPKLSVSCFNLTSPVKSKSSVPYSSSNSNSRSRHLVYSSTETLNRDQSKNNLWRTVSVDTLNPPFKYSFPSLPSNSKTYEKGPLTCKEPELTSSKETLPKRYSNNLLSDSDDSSNLNTPFYVKNHSYSGQCRGETSTTSYAHQNGYSTKRMTSYCSENSIESLKEEESDTEESLLSCADDSNMPSVKELAFKFDSLKNTKNKSSEVRKHHENLRPSRNRNVPTSPSYNNNNINFNNDNNNSSRKYNDRVIVNEVRIGGKPTKIYGKNINTDYPRLPYRFEGFKEIGSESNIEESLSPSPRVDKPSTTTSSSDVFSSTDKVSNHFTFEDIHHKHRNRFSTSELNKADEFWGSYGSSNLQKMKTLNVSNSSSIAESDISVATLPAIPDSNSRDVNDIFGIKLRKGDFLYDKNKHASGSSSDIFPISKINRPKSMPDFRIIQDLSDEESDSMNKHDPVIARTHNLPKFHANITKKEEKSYKTSISISLHNVSANREPLKYESKNYNSNLNFGTFTRDKRNGTRMYDFIRKYENKKSLEEIHSYIHHDEPKSEDKKVTTPVENDGEKQIKQATDVNFNVPLKPKFKKRGSMQDFLKMYSNKTTLPPIPNSEEGEVVSNVKINNSGENLNNQSDFSTKEKQDGDSVNLNTLSVSNEKKTTYISEASVQVYDSKGNIEPNKSNISKNYEKQLSSEGSNAQTIEIASTDKSGPDSRRTGPLAHGSTNKPMVKPKPIFISSSKNATEEETKNATEEDTVDHSTKEINRPSRLPENFVEIKPDYSKQKYNFKVSKYYIMPKVSQINEDEPSKELNTPNLIKNDEKLFVTKVARDQEINNNTNYKIEDRLQNVSTHIDDTCDDKLHVDDTSQNISLSTNYKERESILIDDPRGNVIQHGNTRNDDKFKDRSQHVSTLIYGSMNKPITKPKPKLLTSNKKANESEIIIEENSENHINIPRHSNNTAQIASDSSVANDKIRVSKYHITTKNIYHQYLHNYSNIKSLKEIHDQKDDSENFRLAPLNSVESNAGETFSISTKDSKKNESSDNNKDKKSTILLQSTKSKSDLLINASKENCKDTSHDIVSENKNYLNFVDSTEVEDKESYLNLKSSTKSEKETQSLKPGLNFKHLNNHVLDNDLPMEENINIYKVNEVKNKDNNVKLNESNKVEKLLSEDETLIPKVNNINETLINHDEKTSSNKSENKENLNKGYQISKSISSKVSEAECVSQFTSDLVETNPKFSINESNVENFVHNSWDEGTTHKTSTTDKTKIDSISTKNISSMKPKNFIVTNCQPNEASTEIDAHIKELKQVLNVDPTNLDAETNQTNYFKTKRKPATPPIIDDNDTDPLSLTKRIVKGARCGSSGLSVANKYNISMATLPEKSPFVYKQRKFEDVTE